MPANKACGSGTTGTAYGRRGEANVSRAIRSRVNIDRRGGPSTIVRGNLIGTNEAGTRTATTAIPACAVTNGQTHPDWKRTPRWCRGFDRTGYYSATSPGLARRGRPPNSSVAGQLIGDKTSPEQPSGNLGTGSRSEMEPKFNLVGTNATGSTNIAERET